MSTVSIAMPASSAVAAPPAAAAIDGGGAEAGGWTKENLQWMSLWARQISITQLMFMRAARYWWRIYLALAIAASVFTAASGAVQVPTVDNCPIKSGAACLSLQWIGICCSALGVFLTGTLSVVGANTRSELCKGAADALCKLALDIDSMVGAQPNERQPHAEFAKDVAQQYSSILEKAPPLPSSHSFDTSLPNHTLAAQYQQNSETMLQLQSQHILQSAAAPQPPSPPPLLSPIEKELIRTINDQRRRLDEHIGEKEL